MFNSNKPKIPEIISVIKFRFYLLQEINSVINYLVRENNFKLIYLVKDRLCVIIAG